VGIFSSALVFSKVAYRFIERVMKVVTVITLGGLLISVVLVGSLGDWRAFLGFLFNPLKLGQGVDWTGFDYSKLVTGIVFAGMGGFLNLMYSYWVKDKGVGAAFFSKKISGVLVKEKGEFEAEIIEIEDDGLFLEKVGADRSRKENETDQHSLKTLDDPLFEPVHSHASPTLALPVNSRSFFLINI